MSLLVHLVQGGQLGALNKTEALHTGSPGRPATSLPEKVDIQLSMRRGKFCPDSPFTFFEEKTEHHRTSMQQLHPLQKAVKFILGRSMVARVLPSNGTPLHGVPTDAEFLQRTCIYALTCRR